MKYLFPALILLFTACAENASKPEKKAKTVVVLKSEKDMDARVNELKLLTETSGMMASSLSYQNSEGVMEQVNGYVDSTQMLHILEENFSEGNGKSSGKRLFYLQDGKPFVVHELINEVSADSVTSIFIDRISYYDKKGKVIKTKERTDALEENAIMKSYKPAPLHSVSMDRAMRALNSEKEFETTFQGFVSQGIFTYLVLGENKADGFTTALRLDYKDKLIHVLYQDPKKYLGSKVKVNFENHDDRGFQFQVYAGGEFVD